jgi:NDP-sugar pyrophosphorylase family protein
MTEQIPKPMLKVGNRPILESIVQNFVEQGFCKFFISVNYLSNQIKEYFGDGKQFGAEISYVHESQELGTAGAIGSISKDLSSNLIVMNGDILTAQNFGDVIDFHQIHNADATMVVRKWSQQIPFGVVNLDGERIIDIAEKPVIQKFISAGIYVLSKVVTDLVNQNEPLDMPDLFARSNEKGLKLIAYEMDGYFTDVGRIDDFDRASRDWYQTTND